ncbi:TPA: hypothetical protein I9Y63_003161 [Legionella pneumophila]|nr:hypothetical protein [Legionella pneumophila]HAT3984179.1 hypothetical protein [Legionella pneumophila]
MRDYWSKSSTKRKKSIKVSVVGFLDEGLLDKDQFSGVSFIFAFQWLDF